ncbi:MAG: hypothetical protein J5I98_13695 [Phaeodactylibacter sp.]|nr:hypothetical protein [Phaeodactylibacter sp.]
MRNLLTAIFFQLLLTSCIKEECDFSGNYEFVLPATLSPAVDTFKIGDTITINSTFDNFVMEEKTGGKYFLDNWKFFLSTTMAKIDTFPVENDALKFFEQIIDTSLKYEYQLYNSGISALEGEYRYDQNQYYLNFHLVPKSTGLYVVFQASLLNHFGENQEFPGKCKRKSSSARVALNGSADNNIEFLRNSPDPHYSEWILARPEDRFHRGGGYCFYVVE